MQVICTKAYTYMDHHTVRGDSKQLVSELLVNFKSLYYKILLEAGHQTD
jgi:hypothetical protein